MAEAVSRPRIPFASQNPPRGFVTMTIRAKIRVFHRSPALIVRISLEAEASDSFFCATENACLMIRHKFLALRAQAQIVGRFLVQALALFPIENRLSDDTPSCLRPEIILAVEPLDPVHQLGLVQNAGIDNVG